MATKPIEPALADADARAQALDPRGSFIVQAPAGSGKTELLTHRFLELLARVEEPEQILAITFTRAATAEMRERVLCALKQARDRAAKEDGPEVERRITVAARAALEADARRGWSLLEQPHRLNIQTIDSLCLMIAQETPLLSRLGGSLTPIEDAEPLYRAAARQTLARLGGQDAELSSAIQSLLELRDTSLSDCENLIAGMLAQRDQWGRVLPLGPKQDWEQIRTALETPFLEEHRRVMARAKAILAEETAAAGELISLLCYACENLEETGLGSPVLSLSGMTAIEQMVEHRHWIGLSEFLLKKSGDWRVKVTKTTGFPAGAGGKKAEARAMKERFGAVIEILREKPELLRELCAVRNLPPLSYSSEQWQLLRQILILLYHAAAELRVIFAGQNQLDFVELGLAAAQVLRDETERLPADLAARWPHLLVDEFQDTSRAQYDLFSLLVEAREQDGTCFFVGDPMQSIYGFRQAEVELFEGTRRHGLGEGGVKFPLTPLGLTMNFRSHAGLVEPLNNIFAPIFGAAPGGVGYHVAFAPSESLKPAASSAPAIHVAAQFLPSGATPQEAMAARQAEAAEIAGIVQSYRPQMDAAEREGGTFRIAILARAKRHLWTIAKALREAGIPYRAVEIEELGERQEVLDAASLARALMHPMDRIAWLSVLRAPWCGLTLTDLHTLTGADDPQLAKRPILELLRMRTGLLSSDGKERAAKTLAALQAALRGKHREASFAQWVERTWQTLGGPECVDRAGYDNVRSFFDMFAALGKETMEFERRLSRLFAAPDPRAGEKSGVQLMTIHKAKGLEFEVVLVPGLHEKTDSGDAPLLTWLERTTLEGPEEIERHEFLVAPIGRKKESEPLYDWISRQRRLRQQEEAKRLFYVACTRASRELYLFGTATVSLDAAGNTSLKPGPKYSLLATAWPGIADRFQDRFDDRFEEEYEKSRTPRQPGAPASSTPPPQLVEAAPTPNLLRRLPVDWRSSPAGEIEQVEMPQAVRAAEDGEIFERPGGSLKARAVGSVVHALFEELARLSGGAAEVAGGMDRWRARAAVMLRQAGLARPAADAESARVVQALKNALEDRVGRWILSAQPEAETESSWSSWREVSAEDTLATLRADRIFRAGALPESAGETHVWIVDYKTAQHSAAGLEEFLAAERTKYEPQLARYGQMMRLAHGMADGLAHGPALPLRLALYYPLLPKLIWWEG